MLYKYKTVENSVHAANLLCIITYLGHAPVAKRTNKKGEDIVFH